MSPGVTPAIQAARCFPRVSGDEPHSKEGGLGVTKFSPRERG